MLALCKEARPDPKKRENRNFGAVIRLFVCYLFESTLPNTWFYHPILAALKSCSTIHTSIRGSARFFPCGGLFCIYWRIKAVYMKELFVGFFGPRGCHRRIYGQFCWSQAIHQSVSSKLESDTCTTSITWDLQAYRGYDRPRITASGRLAWSRNDELAQN